MQNAYLNVCTVEETMLVRWRRWLMEMFLLTFCPLRVRLAAAPHSLLNFLHDSRIEQLNVDSAAWQSHSVRALGAPRRTRLPAISRTEFSCSIFNMMKTSVVGLSHFSRCENEERNPKKPSRSCEVDLQYLLTPTWKWSDFTALLSYMKLSGMNLKCLWQWSHKRANNWWDKFVMLH